MSRTRGVVGLSDILVRAEGFSLRACLNLGVCSAEMLVGQDDWDEEAKGKGVGGDDAIPVSGRPWSVRRSENNRNQT